MFMGIGSLVGRGSGPEWSDVLLAVSLACAVILAWFWICLDEGV